jgi:cytoskeleton protein RodZ
MATLLSDRSQGGRASHDVPTSTVDTDMSLGQLLGRARERRGLTLQQVANETKISLRHLEALEHDDLAALTDQFYRRAQIRTYARAIHSDERLAIALFERALQASVVREVVHKPAPGRAPWFSAKRLLIVAGVVLAAAVLGRVIGRPESVFLRGARVSPADNPAPQPAVAVPHALPKDAMPALQPTQLDQARPSTERGADMPGLEPAGARASAAPVSDVPAGTEQASARPSADSFTELVVTTEPAGGRVTVNGVGWGIAPVTIRYLSPGVKRIRITKEGYAPEERVVHLVEGNPKTLDVRLGTAQ